MSSVSNAENTAMLITMDPWSNSIFGSKISLGQTQGHLSVFIWCLKVDSMYKVPLGFSYVTWYLRHKTELPSWLDSFPFLDIVSRYGALSAHRVPCSVPVGILKQPETWKHNVNIGITLKSFWRWWALLALISLTKYTLHRVEITF